VAPFGEDPPKGAKWLDASRASLPERNRRWRKSHQNKNLTAPHSKECEICENLSRADRRSADRQLIVGIQNRQPLCVHARLPPYKKLRRFVGRRNCAAFSLLEAAHFVVPNGSWPPSGLKPAFAALLRKKFSKFRTKGLSARIIRYLTLMQ
jgi:ribosomal protein L32